VPLSERLEDSQIRHGRAHEPLEVLHKESGTAVLAVLCPPVHDGADGESE
jgi:hypothetical protein